MEIYPEDLGPRQCGQVLEHRMWSVGTDGAGPAPTVLPFGRVQTQSRPNAFAWHYPIGSFLAAGVTSATFHISFWVAFLFCIIIALLWRQGRRGEAQALPSVQRGFAEPKTATYAALTEPEIAVLQNNLLRKGGDDPLLGLYLDLVWAAMSLAPLPAEQAETERHAREAIRALGGAIETLPPRTLDGVPDSFAKLQATATRLAAEAPDEPDPVIAASLTRRAEALRDQAETVARVKVLLRRNGALREELADQIGALRTSLAAAALGGDGSGPGLAGLAALAARIRRVVLEADAVTAARVEVDTLLSQPMARAAVPPAEELPPQRLGLDGEAL